MDQKMKNALVERRSNEEVPIENSRTRVSRVVEKGSNQKGPWESQDKQKWKHWGRGVKGSNEGALEPAGSEESKITAGLEGGEG